MRYNALGTDSTADAMLTIARIHREMRAAYAAAPWGSDLAGIRRAADEAWAAHLAAMDLSDPRDVAYLDRVRRRDARRAGLRHAHKRLVGRLLRPEGPATPGRSSDNPQPPPTPSDFVLAAAAWALAVACVLAAVYLLLTP